MTMASTRWRAPELSTYSVTAIDHYTDGVAALAAGAAHAGAYFDAAVAADPLFALAHVGVAVVHGRAVVVPEGAPMNRAERHHAETVRAWLGGDAGHGRDLRREHLLEFPGDLLVVVLPLIVVP